MKDTHLLLNGREIIRIFLVGN